MKAMGLFGLTGRSLPARLEIILLRDDQRRYGSAKLSFRSDDLQIRSNRALKFLQFLARRVDSSKRKQCEHTV